MVANKKVVHLSIGVSSLMLLIAFVPLVQAQTTGTQTGTVIITVATCGIDKLLPAVIDYGSLTNNQESEMKTASFEKFGAEASIQVKGTNWQGAIAGSTMPVGTTHFTALEAKNWGTATELTESLADTGIDDTEGLHQYNLYWFLKPSLADTAFTGQLNQGITLAAIC